VIVLIAREFVLYVYMLLGPKLTRELLVGGLIKRLPLERDIGWLLYIVLNTIDLVFVI